MDITPLLWILAVVLIAAGVAGLALPMLPGAPLLFGGLLLAAWAEDFAYVGTGGIITLGILAALTYAVDIIAAVLGAKKFGASKQAIIGAAIGTLVGLFFGFVGILLGPFLGAVIGELMVRKRLAEAGKSGLGTTLGLIVGTAAKLALAFMMIGVFLVLRFI
jgi:hypothetical protein